MKVIETELPGVLLIEPDVYRDARGAFFETWQKERYQAAGLPAEFVQDNLSYSNRSVLRGLHYQHPKAQGKLVTVVDGEVFDVAVDLRVNSPAFGRWVGALLSGENHRQLFIPAGFAHGFCVTGTHALFSYKCTTAYDPGGEFTLRWDDPAIGITWPIDRPLVSDKDAAGALLADIPPQRLPVYRGQGA